MILSYKPYWFGPSTPPPTPPVKEQRCGHILTESEDFLTTEDGLRLVTECFVTTALGVSFYGGGRPVYIKPRKRKPAWPGEEIEEEEVDELVSMLGIEL